ncbi:MAG: hypothetical protein HOV97_13855 [Nonomuraea sp.]|nr:hypothetical protein [Nonomuraea sp.]
MSVQDTPRPRRGVALLTLLFDVASPIVTFYLLRAAGLSTFLALLLSAVPPALSTLYQVVYKKRRDSLAAFMVGITILSSLASLIDGSPRFLLAKDGYLTGIAGVWLVATMRANPPIVFIFARPLLEGRIGPHNESWDVLWERLPGFRRIWRTASVIWGVATILDAGVRFVMAYTLPVDVVPALNAAQYAVLFVVLQIATNIYYFRAGMYDPGSELYAPLTAEPASPAPDAESRSH